VTIALSLALELATTAYPRRLRCHGAVQAKAWLEQLPTSRFAWFLLASEKERLVALVAASPVPLHLHPPSAYWLETA
jgi:hypothetical protein